MDRANLSKPATWRWIRRTTCTQATRAWAGSRKCLHPRSDGSGTVFALRTPRRHGAAPYSAPAAPDDTGHILPEVMAARRRGVLFDSRQWASAEYLARACDI